MGLDSKHPEYVRHARDWCTAYDCYAGQRSVKERDGGQCYLPPTSGQVAKGLNKGAESPGARSYCAYLARARFHAFFKKAVQGYLGFLWTKKPQFKVPAALKYMEDEKALSDGGKLDQALLKTHTEVLKSGWLGLQLTMSTEEQLGEPRPYISMWCALSITNWHVNEAGELDLVVLDECGDVMDPVTLEWTRQEAWRVLWIDPADGNYKWNVFTGTKNFSTADMKPFTVRSQPVKKIPFVMVSYEDLVPCARSSPLMDLIEADLGLYRLEADYRTALFMQTQATFFHKGLKAEATDGGSLLLGAESALEGNDNETSHCEWVGIDGAGLERMEKAVENDKVNAARLAGDLIDDKSHDKSSAEALDIQHGAQTSKLNQLAMTTAEGMEKLLNMASEWVGAGASAVEVTPNLEFVSRAVDGAQLKSIMEAMVMGAPLSKESLHKYEQRMNLTDMTFEDELAAIESEGPFVDEEKDPALQMQREAQEQGQENADADRELAATALKAKSKAPGGAR